MKRRVAHADEGPPECMSWDMFCMIAKRVPDDLLSACRNNNSKNTTDL